MSRSPFAIKRLRPLTITVAVGSYTFDVVVGVERDEERGTCWRLNIGALELRWWIKK